MKKKYKALCSSAVLISSILMSSITSHNNTTIKEDDLLNNEEPIGYEDTIIYEDKKVEETEKTHYDFGYIGYNADIYDAMMNKISYIEQYQKVIVLADYGNMKKIEYTDSYNNLQTGFIFSDAIKTLPNTFIEVDISDQTLKMYIDGEEALKCLVITGNANTSPTDLGCFYIWAMEQNVTLKGYNPDGTIKYEKFVNYWMPFNGGQGIHDAEIYVDEDGTSHGWRKPDDFGGTTYQYNGSGGCVNGFNADAKFVYENSEVGTKVLVHK